jgi:hypothetical protein
VSLSEQSSALRQRVKNLDVVRAKTAEVGKLKLRYDEAHQLESGLSNIATMAGLLRDAGITLPSTPATVKEARNRLAVVRQRFSGDPRSATLTQGQDWNVLIRTTNDVITTVHQQIQNAWKAYVKGLYTGNSPNDMAATIAKTDRNEEVLKRYRLVFEQLELKGQTFPKSREEINETKDLADRLRTIVREFDLQVPASVKRFLDEVSQNNAGLDLATSEVIDWLRENGTFHRYKIVAGRQ